MYAVSGHRRTGPPQNFQGDGANTKAARACGQAGGRGSVEGAEEGCQETAIWEQGQERTSWQQLRGAKQKPLDWTREERKCWRK